MKKRIVYYLLCALLLMPYYGIAISLILFIFINTSAWFGSILIMLLMIPVLTVTIHLLDNKALDVIDELDL